VFWSPAASHHSSSSTLRCEHSAFEITQAMKGCMLSAVSSTLNRNVLRGGEQCSRASVFTSVTDVFNVFDTTTFSRSAARESGHNVPRQAGRVQPVTAGSGVYGKRCLPFKFDHGRGITESLSGRRARKSSGTRQGTSKASKRVGGEAFGRRVI
jgi:hypothetical protein